MTPKYGCVAFFTYDELVHQIINIQFIKHIFMNGAYSNILVAVDHTLITGMSSDAASCWSFFLPLQRRLDSPGEVPWVPQRGSTMLASQEPCLSLYYNYSRVTVAYSWPWLEQCETSQVEFGTTANHTSTRDTAVRLFRWAQYFFELAITIKSRTINNSVTKLLYSSINKLQVLNVEVLWHAFRDESLGRPT